MGNFLAILVFLKKIKTNSSEGFTRLLVLPYQFLSSIVLCSNKPNDLPEHGAWSEILTDATQNKLIISAFRWVITSDRKGNVIDR